MNIFSLIANFLIIQFYKPRWLRRFLGLNPQGIAFVYYEGKKYFLYLGDLYGPSYHLMHWGVSTYEPENRRYIRKVVGRDGVFLDIGSNIGIFSMVAALQGGNVRVYAFDPDEKAQECLRASVAANNCQNLEILPYAVSNVDGDGEFFLDKKNHGGNSLDQSSIESDVDSLERKVVKLITIDRFVSSRGLSKVDLIKIDVQSHEHEVLLGAVSTIQRLRPIVFVECSSIHIGGPKDPFDFFTDLNYEILDPINKNLLTLEEARNLYKQKAAYYDLFFFPKEKKYIFA